MVHNISCAAKVSVAIDDRLSLDVSPSWYATAMVQPQVIWKEGGTHEVDKDLRVAQSTTAFSSAPCVHPHR